MQAISPCLATTRYRRGEMVLTCVNQYLARGVVSQEPADRFGGGGKMLGVLPRLEQLSSRRECGDLAAGLGRVVLIDPGEDEHRRAEGPHLVPGHADGEVGSPHCGGERLDLVAGEIVALVYELLTPRLPQVVKELPVARGDPDRLLEDGRDDSFRRDREQLQDERAADAAAEHQEPVDAQMIHDCELVCRVGTPRVASLKRAGGLAGVALVHRNHLVLPGVRGQRVDRCHLPQWHARAHPAWCQRQHRKPCPLPGVPDLRLATVDVRHTGLLSRLRFRDPAYGRAARDDWNRRRARPHRTGASAQTCRAAALPSPRGNYRRSVRSKRSACPDKAMMQFESAIIAAIELL